MKITLEDFIRKRIEELFNTPDPTEIWGGGWEEDMAACTLEQALEDYEALEE